MKASPQKGGWGCREIREGCRRGYWKGNGGLGLLGDWRGLKEGYESKSTGGGVWGCGEIESGY